MTTRKLDLLAPNSLPIVGIKLTDNSVSQFECTYDDNLRTFVYVLPSGNAGRLQQKSGTSILVDSKGNEWSASDVEYYSVLHR